MKQATKKQLLNAQKVDGAIISEENGTIAFRKAPWNDTEVICEQPKVIPGRMVFSAPGSPCALPRGSRSAISTVSP